MAAEEPNLTANYAALETFDLTFFKLFERLSHDCIDKAASCTEQVFNISKGFLDKDASTVLKKFYDLYFGSDDMEQRKEEMNKSVDDLFDQVQANMDAGRDLETGLDTNQEEEKERLGLAGLQKKLEGLISIDEGIRAKLIPALASMQFEDAVRQRLDHINAFWRQTIEAINAPEATDFDGLAREMANLVSSPEEATSFYRILLDEEPPEAVMSAGDALMF